MKKITNIQIKATLLLVVFSMSNLIGFACSVEIDMGFNSTHHKEERAETAIHVHPDGEKHLHNNKAPEHHDASEKEKSKKDDCCSDDVASYQALDKVITNNTISVFSIPVFTSIFGEFASINIFSSPRILPQKYILPLFHPPPPDIGLFIHNFRI